MRIHFFTAPFYFAFIWFRALVAALLPLFRRWYSRIAAFPSRGRCPAGADRVTMAYGMKDSWDKVFPVTFACSDRAAARFMGGLGFPLAYITYRTCEIHQISFLKYGIFLIPHVSTTPSV